MIPGVRDFAQQQQQLNRTGFDTDKAATLATPEQLRATLSQVKHQPALIVMLIDILDASGSLLGKVRDLVGRNPVILIATKVDLLPGRVDPDALTQWLAAAADYKKLTISDVHLVSSRTGFGVERAVAAIRRERRGRDTYVMGAANVGKSAFIRVLVNDMASASSRQFDPAATHRRSRLPVESSMPGTTLGLIPMPVFAAGGMLYDTPGLHLHHRLPHMLTPEENKVLTPRKKIKAYVAPSYNDVIATSINDDDDDDEDDNEEEKEKVDTKRTSTSTVAVYKWGGIARIEVEVVSSSRNLAYNDYKDNEEQGVDVQLAFYGPPSLKVDSFTEGNEEEREEDDSLTFGENSVVARGGLKLARKIDIDVYKQVRSSSGGGSDGAVMDIAVSGLPGWVGVYMKKEGGRRGGGGGGREEKWVKIQVWAPVGVEVFQRPPLPVPSPLL
jgi:nitric-oxide synthase, plant